MRRVARTLLSAQRLLRCKDADWSVRATLDPVTKVISVTPVVGTLVGQIIPRATVFGILTT